jgi:hypothetical protein
MIKNKMRFDKNNRGQVTLFVILALAIISIILVFIFWIQPNYISPKSGAKQNIEGCIEEAVKESIKQIEKQYAGFSGLTFSYMYQGERIPYLCYTNLYLQQCINQKPFLLQHFSEELEKMSKQGILNCYEKSISDLKNRGFEVNEGEKQIKIELEPGQIIASLIAPVSTSQGGVTQSTSEFKAVFDSPIYNMLMIATYIVQQETRYGDSVIEDAMLLHPEILITKIRRDEGNKVYILEDKYTKDIIKFATRSVPWPVGYGVGDSLMRRQ